MQDHDWLRILGVAGLGFGMIDVFPSIFLVAAVALLFLARRSALFGYAGAVTVLSLVLAWAAPGGLAEPGLLVAAVAVFLTGMAAFRVRSGHAAGTCALVAGCALAAGTVVTIGPALGEVISGVVAVVTLLGWLVLGGSLFVLGTAWRDARMPPEYVRAV